VKKWKTEAIIAVVLVCASLGIWWFVATKDERQAKAQFELLVNFANRQQVEIAIITQNAELKRLKQLMPQSLPQSPVDKE